MTHPSFAGVKACIFDAYGTLFDVHSAVRKGGAALGDKAAAISETWRVKQLEYTWLRSLMGVHVDFWQVTRDGLDYAFAAHAVHDATLADDLMALYLGLDAYPEVPEVLATLKAGGLTTGVLSNGSPGMLNSAVASAELGEHLDHLLSVEEVGIYKPDPRVYQLAVDRTSVERAEICFLSSNAWDAYAAANFGFRVAWVNRFAREKERLPKEPEVMIGSLSDLPPLLG